MSNRFQVIWTPTAKADLIGIIKYIANDNKTAAKKAAHRIKERAQNLTSSPKRGRVVSELRNFGILIYRELIVKPWRLIYRVEGKKVFILAVLDSRRDLESHLLERLLR